MSLVRVAVVIRADLTAAALQFGCADLTSAARGGAGDDVVFHDAVVGKQSRRRVGFAPCCQDV